MRAVVLTEYGDPDVLSVQELPDPPVGPDVVLVRVAAAGANPVDYKIRRGYLLGVEVPVSEEVVAFDRALGLAGLDPSWTP